MPDFERWGSSGDPSLNEINRADRFIDALSTQQPAYPTDHAEAELAFLLADWRDGVRDTPIGTPVSTTDAVAALQGGLAGGRRPRRSFAVVGSVAAAMLCIGGFGTAVYGAGPGDSLYGMRTAVFGSGEVTRDDQVSLASAQLQQVQQLIDQGDWEQAQDKLVALSTTVQGVDDQVGDKQQLVEQWNALTYKVVEQDPAATLPAGEPLPVLPSSPLTWLPVPVVVDPSTSPSSDGSSTSTSTDTSVTDTSGPSEIPPTTLPDGSTTLPSESTATESTAPPQSPASPPSTPGPTESATSPTATSSSPAPSSTAPTPTSSSPTPTPTSSPSVTTTTTTTTTPPRGAEAPPSAVPSSVVTPSLVQSVPPAASAPVAPRPALAPPSAPVVAPSEPVVRPSAEQQAPRSVEPTVTATTTIVPVSPGGGS